MKKPEDLWKRYAVALSLIAFFVTATFTISEYALHESKGIAEAINKSGRQRMLSQRISFLANDLIQENRTGEEKQKDYRHLKQARDLFEKSHQLLLYRDPENTQLTVYGEKTYGIYFEQPYKLDDLVQNYISLVDIVISSVDISKKQSAAMQIRNMALNDILVPLDLVVQNIEQLSNERVEYLSRLERISFILALLVLLFEAIFIFYPSHIFIKRKIKEQKTLEQQKIKAAQASKMATLGEMSAGIVHEINNPLTIIYGQIEIVKHALKSLSVYKNQQDDKDDIEQRLSKIQSATERISQISENLRSFSRQTQDDIFESCSMAEIAENAMDMVKPALDRHNISLYINYEYEPFLLCKPIEIEQVLINLIMNAKDAIKNLDEKWIRIKVEKKNLKVKVSVIDSGKGIKTVGSEDIFESFFTTKGEDDGTGLGLSISKSIIEKYDGIIYYEQNQEQTSFAFELKAYSS